MAALVERGLRTVALVGLVELGVAVLAAGRWGEVLRARLALPVDSSLAHSMGRRGTNEGCSSLRLLVLFHVWACHF